MEGPLATGEQKNPTRALNPLWVLQRVGHSALELTSLLPPGFRLACNIDRKKAWRSTASLLRTGEERPTVCKRHKRSGTLMLLIARQFSESDRRSPLKILVGYPSVEDRLRSCASLRITLR